MTREYVLLLVAGALIAIGLFVIVTALRRAKRREEARERVDALLTLLTEPTTIREPEVETEEPWDGHFREASIPEPRSIAPAPVPRPRPIRVASSPQFVFTRSDSSGSFGVRPGSDLGSTGVRHHYDRGQTSV
jgi:hypothetical protein